MSDLNYRNFVSKYNDKMPLSFYNGAIEAWNHQQQKIDELQKRIDDALKEFEENNDPWSMIVDEVIKILKGNQS